MRLEFFKMTAAGNDFIIIDARGKSLSLSPALISKLCNRREGIGADGVLLLQDCEGADVLMQVFNSDGSQAQMCGNGARCIGELAPYLKLPHSLRIKTLSADVYVQRVDGGAKVFFPLPKEIRLWQRLTVDGTHLILHSINTGVPHAVLFVQDLDTVDVESVGRMIRHSPLFLPDGVNVNFVKVLDTHTLKIRTYERGVEEETPSCGTGAVAASCLSYLLALTSSPIYVESRNERVCVEFEEGFSSLSLFGKACLLFKGVWEVEDV
jgi:diaminopimelate epimerase